MEQEQTTQLMHYDFHLDTGEEYRKEVLEFPSDEEAYEHAKKNYPPCRYVYNSDTGETIWDQSSDL